MVPLHMMPKFDRQIVQNLSRVRLFVYLEGRLPWLKPKWDGEIIEEPVIHETTWFEYCGELLKGGSDSLSWPTRM